jgi:phosphate/sulfate permease
MNALNALVFAAVGSAMELLPRLCPSLFPHGAAAETSSRALWVLVMGAVQIVIGLGFLFWSRVLPLSYRLVSAAHASHPALALAPAPTAPTR